MMFAKLIDTILPYLVTASIIAGGGAITKVMVLEQRVNFNREILLEIRQDIKEIKQVQHKKRNT